MEDTWDSVSTLLSETTRKALEDLEFSKMTPVQAACIPLFVQNKDVAVEAVTGSGKTLAFVIPLIEQLLKRGVVWKKHEVERYLDQPSSFHVFLPIPKYSKYSDVGAIILTPTRELALQIEEVVLHFLKYLSNLTVCLLIGGSSIKADIDRFLQKGGNILVTTPGRFIDLLKRKQNDLDMVASVKFLEVLVLDEADRLLDIGFEVSINTILSYLPKQRRTGLFSATQTDEVENLIRAGLRNPVRVTVKEKQTNSKIIQRTPLSLTIYYMVCECDEKFNQLVNFLHRHQKEKMMVFFSTCAAVDYFSQAIQQILQKRSVLAIHGKMKHKRSAVFSKFRKVTCGILICTDVMARGVDIPDVHWVLQYDPPSSASAFVHRSGRTARLGNTGSALVFLLPNEDSYVQFIAINQKVPMHKYHKVENVPNSLEKLQQLSLQDRAVYEKSMRAFVSFVQSYGKHECSMIFNLKELDFGQLATGFGLLKIPKMPELKHKTITTFQPSDVDVNCIPYRDKNKERLRQQRIKDGTLNVNKKRYKPKVVPWSKKKKKKDAKQKRRENKIESMKRQMVVAAQDEQDDAAELEKDARLIKKLKRRKISANDFEKEFITNMENAKELTDNG